MAHTDTLTNMITNIYVDVCLSVTALSALHLSSFYIYKSGLSLCMTTTNKMLRKSETGRSDATGRAIEWWLLTLQTWMQSQTPSHKTNHGTGAGFTLGLFSYPLLIVIPPLLHTYLLVALWTTQQPWADSMRILKTKGWGMIKLDTVLTRLIIIQT